MVLSRRKWLLSVGAAVAAETCPAGFGWTQPSEGIKPLEEFSHSQVAVLGARQQMQRANSTDVLMSLNEDSLLQPFRQMNGLPAPGASLGGWYEFLPGYDFHHGDAGLAPGSTFGQWISALSRLSAGLNAAQGRTDEAMAARVRRLNAALREAIGPDYFRQTRFAGYSFDKLVGGLVDAHRLAGDIEAWATLERVSDAAGKVLPAQAVDREVQWAPGRDISWMWDETYTLPENLYLASAAGAGPRYRRLAEAYLDDSSYFEPLSRGVNVLSDKHAYSYVNALCSAMQAYLAAGSGMHLKAARHGFDLLEAQSFCTGGWGPEETLRKPGLDQLALSLTATHNSFETPCGGYAHMKLTRYLLRATHDGRYGDSMERVMHNTVLGALPLQPDGRCFYSSDYNVTGRKVYSVHRWPCCSGTLPQVVADYGINGYLRDDRGVWVNLYQESELRWMQSGTTVSLRQRTRYPEDGRVRLELSCGAPISMALRLRTPAWAGTGATLRVNGKETPSTAERGFVTINRIWRSGDTVEIELPLALRLEELPPDAGKAHPDTVALLWGPLVLFAVRDAGEQGTLKMRREDLMNAERTGAFTWQAGARVFTPFTELGERGYSTYMQAI